MPDRKIKVLMVCMGNICRSPTAEGVFRALLQQRGLEQWIDVDSAGTGDWKVGQCPDPQAIKAAERRNYDICSLVARQVTPEDIEAHDYVIAMDWDNFSHLKSISEPAQHGKISMLLDHTRNYFGDVPDPYRDNDEAFELVLDMVEDGCAHLLDKIIQKHGIPT